MKCSARCNHKRQMRHTFMLLRCSLCSALVVILLLMFLCFDFVIFRIFMSNNSVTYNALDEIAVLQHCSAIPLDNAWMPFFCTFHSV